MQKNSDSHLMQLYENFTADADLLDFKKSFSFENDHLTELKLEYQSLFNDSQNVYVLKNTYVSMTVNYAFTDTIINFSSEYTKKYTQFNHDKINELNVNEEFMSSLTSVQVFLSIAL